ncbi:hypothetical protein [Kribbella sp. CA-294648]|uniref:hypothetical protein n=1 Tax=Kribbella sp. CA-294648 TaxID=3239948 RepID=UPI003D947DD1
MIRHLLPTPQCCVLAGLGFEPGSSSRHGGDEVLSEDEREELHRLRKENAELRMRCDVLKCSVALWVEDATRR